MHLDPEHVEAYFIRGDPDMEDIYKLEGDVLWSKTEESVRPGILNKTVLSMEYFLSRIHEFDFILRTNLSSFYILPKLLNFMKGLPAKRLYCGAICSCGYRPIWRFASGCGYILSPDLVEMIVENKHLLLNELDDDDVSIAKFLTFRGISIVPANRRDILSLKDWLNYKANPNEDDFHFRVKNEIHDFRFTEDLFIYSEMLKIYYGVTWEELKQLK